MAVVMQSFDGSGPAWNALIERLPNPHLLQTWDWAQLKAAYGWRPLPITWNAPAKNESGVRAAAMILKKQILRRSFAVGLSLLYVPKGPLLDWSDAGLRDTVLDDLRQIAKRERAIFVKVDPDVVLGRGIPGEEDATEAEAGIQCEAELRRRGWLFSEDQIQFRNSVWLDLDKTEDQILARMGQKTRYNIRLASKKGVRVRDGSPADLPSLFRMYAETSARDGFVIRDEAYYRKAWGSFMQNQEQGREPAAEALIAEVEGEAVAALFLFRFAGRAYYLYGMSRQAHREKMPNQLLQWEAIRRAKQFGCTLYDLWGAPDDFEPEDRLWGVFRFKQGLGGEVVRTLGAWDFPASRFWYGMYTGLMPRVLSLMRSRGKARTKQDLAAA